MIQRIQTIWLIFTTVAPLSLFHGAIVKFTNGDGEKFYIGLRGLYKLVGNDYSIFRESLGLPVTIALISIASSITILLFKFRRIQKIITMVIIALSLCLLIMLAFYTYLMINDYNATLQFGLQIINPFVLIVCAIMAYRGIVKDDNLVKSYDRLR